WNGSHASRFPQAEPLCALVEEARVDDKRDRWCPPAIFPLQPPEMDRSEFCDGLQLCLENCVGLPCAPERLDRATKSGIGQRGSSPPLGQPCDPRKRAAVCTRFPRAERARWRSLLRRSGRTIPCSDI